MSYTVELQRVAQRRSLRVARSAITVGTVGPVPVPPEAKVFLLNGSGHPVAQWAGLCTDMRALKERIVADLHNLGPEAVHTIYVAHNNSGHPSTHQAETNEANQRNAGTNDADAGKANTGKASTGDVCQGRSKAVRAIKVIDLRTPNAHPAGQTN